MNRTCFNHPVFLLAVLLAIPMLMAGCIDKPVAVVNGEKITRQALDQRLEKEFGRQALETMTVELLMDQEAARKDIKVTDLEIEEALKEFKDNEQMKAQIDSLQLKDADLKDFIRRRLLFKKLVMGEVSDKERQNFFNPRRTTLQQLHIFHLVVGSREQARKLLEQVKAGQNFSELAGKYSEDPRDKEKGGDMGWAFVGSMPPALLKEISPLKPGQCTGILEDELGYHIFMLKERKSSYEQLKDVVEWQMFNEPARQADYIKRLQSKARVSFPLESLKPADWPVTTE